MRGRKQGRFANKSGDDDVNFAQVFQPDAVLQDLRDLLVQKDFNIAQAAIGPELDVHFEVKRFAAEFQMRMAFLHFGHQEADAPDEINHGFLGNLHLSLGVLEGHHFAGFFPVRGAEVKEEEKEQTSSGNK